ncbi:3'-5' exonuclease [Pseudobacteriovorax antillogorgiicola]|nr:3'-5' exonuclease [Pseudobacteriovorax antillogorgiicola]
MTYKGQNMDTGLIIDLETTGIDPETDKIIELGLIEFRISEDVPVPAITNMYGAVEDPKQALSEEIKKITGLDDYMLQGQKIDWVYVRAAIQRSSIIIAHNADFDRSFLEKRAELAGLEDAHWACSMKHIDWAKHGFKTRALNYLAADHGFVNSFAHRALFDCATTFRLMSPYFAELVRKSFMKEYRVFATAAPFESKDKLKARAYRWDGAKRVWYKTVLEDMIESERVFLAEEVYPDADLHEELILS